MDFLFQGSSVGDQLSTYLRRSLIDRKSPAKRIPPSTLLLTRPYLIWINPAPLHRGRTVLRSASKAREFAASRKHRHRDCQENFQMISIIEFGG